MYKFLVIVLFSCLFSQTTGKLSGSVGDLDKNPLYGVNVIVQDTYYGAASDDNGLFYIINIPPGQSNATSKGMDQALQQVVYL